MSLMPPPPPPAADTSQKRQVPRLANQPSRRRCLPSRWSRHDDDAGDDDLAPVTADDDSAPAATDDDLVEPATMDYDSDHPRPPYRYASPSMLVLKAAAPLPPPALSQPPRPRPSSSSALCLSSWGEAPPSSEWGGEAPLPSPGPSSSLCEQSQLSFPPPPPPSWPAPQVSRPPPVVPLESCLGVMSQMANVGSTVSLVIGADGSTTINMSPTSQALSLQSPPPPPVTRWHKSYGTRWHDNKCARAIAHNADRAAGIEKPPRNFEMPMCGICNMGLPSSRCTNYCCANCCAANFPIGTCQLNLPGHAYCPYAW
jgi:hypothetical protein